MHRARRLPQLGTLLLVLFNRWARAQAIRPGIRVEPVYAGCGLPEGRLVELRRIDVLGSQSERRLKRTKVRANSNHCGASVAPSRDKPCPHCGRYAAKIIHVTQLSPTDGSPYRVDTPI
jgi:hypothetical protein